MEIVPVIDLKGGSVVRARMGERSQYRPIATPLSATSEPVDVVRGLLSVFPFKTLYIADLDAIEGKGEQASVCQRIAATFPHLNLWIDNGMADLAAAESFLAAGRSHLVLGSESVKDGALVRRFTGHARVVLSLDFRAESFQGPPALLENPALWPRRVIVMTLARVGSGAGPDMDRVRAIRSAAPRHDIFAAGGVRDAADLVALKGLGVAGALVASALHDGRLRRSDLEKF
jgi:phosphoribosylformimino-5-aminoimidazole carboxamide ribotide isomerase